MQDLVIALRLDLLSTVYDAYVRMGLFKGHPEDNLIARQWLAAIHSDQYDAWPELKRCLDRKKGISSALFRQAYLNDAINRRKLSYLLNHPGHYPLVLIVISDKVEE